MNWTIWKIDENQTPNGVEKVVFYIVKEGAAHVDGAVVVNDLVITPSTTEQEVVEKVKHALNATKEQRDERGNLVPPAPGTQTRTQEIEAQLAAQVEELAHPKTHSIPLPWGTH